MENQEILLRPIHKLRVSKEFKKGSQAMGFGTLQEILKEAPGSIMGNESFNYVWFGELIDILTAHGLLHLLQPTQGNSRV
ncbi:hypothetical protein ABIC74_000761 [Mucilaginibacter rubeus]|uniref:hypothetical protein n=1 Tax=Mucilaginibacter rubeus TaxID=2027860 RepID=UPI0033930B03